MFILGGILFVEIGCINELFSWDMSLIFQGVVGSIIITASEFVAGVILNLWLKLNVWDYENAPIGYFMPLYILFQHSAKLFR